jgi:hypothetical protein
VANSDNRLRLVSDSDARLRSIIANLEKSQTALAESENTETAQILAMAILQLRMRLHRVTTSELKDLCQAVQLREEAEKLKKPDDLILKDGHFAGRGSRWPNSIK